MIVPIGALLLVSYLSWAVVARKATRRIVRWLRDCAEFGAAKVQNARLTRPDQLPALRLAHDEWVSVIREGAGEYLRESDARGLGLLDDSVAPKALFSAIDEPAQIRYTAAQRVERLLTLAQALERGETRLKRVWPLPR